MIKSTTFHGRWILSNQLPWQEVAPYCRCLLGAWETLRSLQSNYLWSTCNRMQIVLLLHITSKNNFRERERESENLFHSMQLYCLSIFTISKHGNIKSNWKFINKKKQEKIFWLFYMRKETLLFHYPIISWEKKKVSTYSFTPLLSNLRKCM